jgi:putative transposase
MAQSLSDVLIHIVFSTKERYPFIEPAIEDELYAYISAICRNLNSPVIQINGMSDHIHVLLSLGKTITISKLISEMKSNSSRWIKSKGNQYKQFAWQNGYGTFSVARPNIEAVIAYIGKQKDHHKKISFKEELLKLLNRAKITYDEKYLWD